MIEIRWLGRGERVQTHLTSQLFYPLYFHFDVHNYGPFWFHLAGVFFVTVFVCNTKNYSFVIQTTMYKLSTYQYNYFILHAQECAQVRGHTRIPLEIIPLPWLCHWLEGRLWFWKLVSLLYLRLRLIICMLL